MVDGRSDIFAQSRRCETRLSSAPAVSVRLGRQRDWFMNSGSRRHVGPVRHTPGMGRRNRERRTTKQKQRRRSAADREHRPSDIGPDRAQILESLVIAMSTAARSPGPGRAVELVEQCRGFERQLDIAADLVVHDAVREPLRTLRGGSRRRRLIEACDGGGFDTRAEPWWVSLCGVGRSGQPVEVECGRVSPSSRTARSRSCLPR